MENQNKFLRVIDSSCTNECPERTHTIVVHGSRVVVTFKLGTETILPFEQGIKFMIDGFTVEEVDGNVLDLPAVASESVLPLLANDECVAKYSELSTSALKLRAAAKSGGEIYLGSSDDDRNLIVSFLSGNLPELPTDPQNDEVSEDDEDHEGDGLDENIVDAETDKKEEAPTTDESDESETDLAPRSLTVEQEEAREE